MNSRERVLTAVERRQPDKVPIDCGAMRSTGMTAIAYARLKKYLGITSGKIRVYDFMQQLAEIEPEILYLFAVDVVDIVNTSLYPDERKWKPFTLPDGTPAEVTPDIDFEADGVGGYLARGPNGKIWGRMPQGCLYCEMIEPPFGEPRKPVESFELPLFSDEQLEWQRVRAKYLYEHTEYALMGGFGGNILENGQWLRGWGNFMMDLADDPAYVDALVNRMVEWHLENLSLYLDAVGDYLQLIQMGDDLGTQAGPQLSRDMYRRFIFPAHRQIYAYVHEHYPHIKLFLHSCGSVETFMNDFVEEGVDVLNPVQTSAANMEPNYLKKTYGNRLAFWGGGCDTQQVLPTARPEEIREHVRERMRIFAPDGGYVFTTIHNIQANVPPENIIAVYEAAKEFRVYPIKA
ncbi:MAG: methyltransferase [Candidatus Omnitrophota bacterium]|jgi:uroporphyrinogen decarboxylase|nr:MAG: methyltransferase [Candidatus Omnitrophota bacterium]